MITAGLDFGTHQTKVCIEDKVGVECKYTFMKFKDEKGIPHYTIPSVISIGRNGKLKYGYITSKTKDNVIRYFKQGVFCTASENTMQQEDAMLYSCWYLAFILFDLEEKYGTSFSVQMGIPTDGEHYDNKKQIAVQILATAYKLVENIYNNDKKKFLDTKIGELKNLTKIEPFSDELKKEYGILVFPEAYSCLKPLTSKGKIATGMNLIIDIGGGSTDISFFIIKDKKPEVYDFFSIAKGLNYLTNAFSKNTKKEVNDNECSDVFKPLRIDKARLNTFVCELKKVINDLIDRLKNEFNKQTPLDLCRLKQALKDRPLIYCGGGSTYPELRLDYSYYFKDKKLITLDEWDTKSIESENINEFKEIVPILSTAYGLSISVTDDNITKKPFMDIFENIRANEQSQNYANNYTSSSYDDWDALK